MSRLPHRIWDWSYLFGPLPEVAGTTLKPAFVTLSPSLFSVTYVPSGIFGTPLPLHVLWECQDLPWLGVCFRLMGRGLTVTWLTFTVTIGTDLQAYEHCA